MKNQLCLCVLTGGSMRPWLRHGCDIRIRPFVDGFRAGDVAVFRRGDRWIAHRALRSYPMSASRKFHARGDWTGITDVPVGPKALLGRVAAVRVAGSWWSLETPPARLAGLATNALVAVARRMGARRPWGKRR